MYIVNIGLNKIKKFHDPINNTKQLALLTLGSHSLMKHMVVCVVMPMR